MKRAGPLVLVGGEPARQQPEFTGPSWFYLTPFFFFNVKGGKNKHFLKIKIPQFYRFLKVFLKFEKNSSKFLKI